MVSGGKAAGGGDEKTTFDRTITLWPATALNMTQMCGIGPFLTLPLIVGAMGGSWAILGWVLGAVISMMDGLVWAELGAAMPGAGGTYLYLREAFQYRTGRLMPFLFIWTAMISIPLIMSTGVIGILQYSEAFWQQLHAQPASFWQYVRDVAATQAAASQAAAAAAHGNPVVEWFRGIIAVTPLEALICTGIVVLVVVVLYRKIAAIEKFTNVFFGIMLVTIGACIAAAFSHFDPHLAFDFRAPLLGFNAAAFITGLGVALVNATYDYAGYNTAAYLGAEIKDPGRVIPKSIILSILLMMVLYLTLQVGILGTMPTDKIINSQAIGTDVMLLRWGKTAAWIFTILIIITAFASVVTGLLSGSRVPYNAAKDRLFLPIFGRLHSRLHFPHVALLVMAVVTAIGSFFSINTVIATLTAVFVLVQALAQIAALTVLRSRQPTLRRPYKMLLYPLPSIIAFFGWLFVYFASGWPTLLTRLGGWIFPSANAPPAVPLTSSDTFLAPGSLSIYWLILGIVCFLIWAEIEKTWPFGPKEIHEEFIVRDTAEARTA